MTADCAPVLQDGEYARLARLVPHAARRSGAVQGGPMPGKTPSQEVAERAVEDLEELQTLINVLVVSLPTWIYLCCIDSGWAVTLGALWDAGG